MTFSKGLFALALMNCFFQNIVCVCVCTRVCVCVLRVEVGKKKNLEN